MSSLPYFDTILEQIRQGNRDFIVAFGRHVHWALWDDPATADGTVEDFARASERLCQRLCDAAGAQHGMDILDVGCGFGGTVASLNERLEDVRLTGLNIDARQLERARGEIKARPGNEVAFVEGDACQLPFADASFDVVLAVECIFHFPSRLKFFTEARRVLRPGGRLALSDYTPTQPIVESWEARMIREHSPHPYGKTTVIGLDAYRALAEQAGLRPVAQDDVTDKLSPGYAVGERIFAKVSPELAAATHAVAVEAESGLSRYVLLTFDKC